MRKLLETIRIKLIKMLGGTPYRHRLTVVNSVIKGEIRFIGEGVEATIVGCIFEGNGGVTYVTADKGGVE